MDLPFPRLKTLSRDQLEDRVSQILHQVSLTCPGVPLAFRTLAGDPTGGEGYRRQVPVYTKEGRRVRAVWAWKGNPNHLHKGKYLPHTSTLLTQARPQGPGVLRIVKDLTVVWERDGHSQTLTVTFTVKGGSKVVTETPYQAAVCQEEFTLRSFGAKEIPKDLTWAEIQEGWKYGYEKGDIPPTGLGPVLSQLSSSYGSYGDKGIFDFPFRPALDLRGFLWPGEPVPQFPDGRDVPVEGDSVERWMLNTAKVPYVVTGVCERMKEGPMRVRTSSREIYPPWVALDRFWVLGGHERQRKGVPAEHAYFGALTSEESLHLRHHRTLRFLPNEGDPVHGPAAQARGVTGTLTVAPHGHVRVKVQLDTVPAGLSSKEVEDLEKYSSYQEPPSWRLTASIPLWDTSPVDPAVWLKDAHDRGYIQGLMERYGDPDADRELAIYREREPALYPKIALSWLQGYANVGYHEDLLAHDLGRLSLTIPLWQTKSTQPYTIVYDTLLANAKDAGTQDFIASHYEAGTQEGAPPPSAPVFQDGQDRGYPPLTLYLERHTQEDRYGVRKADAGYLWQYSTIWGLHGRAPDYLPRWFDTKETPEAAWVEALEKMAGSGFVWTGGKPPVVSKTPSVPKVVSVPKVSAPRVSAPKVSAPTPKAPSVPRVPSTPRVSAPKAKDPDRYVSTNTDPETGERLWRVIYQGGPEIRDGDMDTAVNRFLQHLDRGTLVPLREDIPVWDGDAGTFTTMAAFPAPALVIPFIPTPIVHWTLDWSTDDYPSGRERVKAKWTVETHPRLGQRICRVTSNPKNGRWNAPKCDTYGKRAILGIGEDGRSYGLVESQYGGMLTVVLGTMDHGGTIHKSRDEDLYNRILQAAFK